MALSGHSKDLSLADLIQANLLGRTTCRIMLSAEQGRGVIYVDGGEVVDAHFLNLTGEDAFYALVTQDDVYFQVDTGVVASKRTISTKWEHLMLQAMRMKDEGRLPTPRPPVLVQGEAPGMPVERGATPSAASSPEPAPAVPPENAAQPRRRLVLVALGSFVLVGAVAAVVVTAPGQRTRPLGDQAAAAPTIAPIEASDPNGSDDVPPRLIEGAAPRSPDPASVIRPVVVCRVLIDEHGAVTSAHVFRPRADIEPFEKAALAAVMSYRFRPGRRAGQPVPVWLDLPISFQ